MDASDLSRWTRFATKGGIGKCTATQDCVAKNLDDLMFLKDDEITVLMQFADQKDVYLGYCEGVVGRFEGADVQFHSKLKTPVMTKRSSSLSKSPRSSSASLRRVSTPLHNPALPAPPTPSSQDGSATQLRALVNSPTPVVPKRLSFVASEEPSQTHSLGEAAHMISSPSHDQSMASTSYSSSSSVQDSTSPRTPAEYPSEITPRGEMSDAGALAKKRDTLDTKSVSQYSERLSVADSPMLSSDRQFDDSGSARFSVAMSDGVVGIGLSLLQDFISGNEDDDDASSSASHRSHRAPQLPEGPSRSSLDNTVEGVAPSVPMPAASVHGSASPQSSLRQSESEFGEEWEGALDIYDNYRYSRYSRMSLASSKMSRMSKSSSFVPPPIPGDFRPSFDRTNSSDAISRRSEESRYSAQPLSPMSPVFADASDAAPGASTSPLDANISKHRPTPLELTASASALTVSTASPLLHTAFGSTASPLLHGTFGSSQSSPALNTASTRSNFSASQQAHEAGLNRAATALRQRFESEREEVPAVPPRPSGESIASNYTRGVDIVVEDEDSDEDRREAAAERDVAPTVSSSTHRRTETGSSVPRSSSEKKRPQLIVANPAPPPPYTPVSPPAPTPLASPPVTAQVSSFTAMPEPVIPLAVRRPPPASTGAPPQPRTSLFAPHPNAPKPTPTPVGPMYGRAAPAPAPSGLVRTLQMAHAARIGPGGRPRLTTIYGMTTIDLLNALGPVPIVFSLEPPNNVPSNRMPKRMVTMGAVGPQSAGSAPVPEREVPAVEEQAPQSQRVASIPRANFYPKVAKPRPRSRSFSGFDTTPLAAARKERSHEEPVESSEKPEPRAGPSRGRPSLTQKQYAPSPLAASLMLPNPFSSVPGTPASPPVEPQAALLSPPQLQINTQSAVQLTDPPVLPPASPSVQEQAQNQLNSPVKSSQVQQQSNMLVDTIASVASPESVYEELPPMSSTSQVPSGDSAPAKSTQARASLKRRDSAETASSYHSDGRSLVTSPQPLSPASTSAHVPSLTRNTSLRSKMSFSALRAKSSTREDSASVTDEQREHETVQVEDMDFELVRPNFPQSSRGSEDSSMPSPVVTEGRLDTGNTLRADSPAASMYSGAASMLRSPASVSDSAIPVGKAGDVEAHRNRELKWISTMASTPPSQARKSKKVRKLLQDGVPASVRYQVWAHLTDSKAKRIDGLYTQLGKRGKPSAFDDIARDTRFCFTDQPQLIEADGPLVSLLSAYLTMVPDIQYHRELTLIAGQLLLQSPEEDAFWIFISLMDTHLRPYFASHALQLEVDASLFAKAMEANDPSVAHKLFVTLNVSPIRLCRSWFAGMFVEALPNEYFQRVWDIFLSEGIVFLFRVGLALITCCRRPVLECTSDTQALEILLRPPSILLSSSPDTLVELANASKLKDDEMRRQRTKLEAQKKRAIATTQVKMLTAPGNGRGPSISLPRS